MIQDLQLVNSRPVAPPLPQGLVLSTDQGEILDDPEPYIQLVGRLFYLNITDLTYATQHLSQFLSCPIKPHLQVAMYVDCEIPQEHS